MRIAIRALCRDGAEPEGEETIEASSMENLQSPGAAGGQDRTGPKTGPAERRTILLYIHAFTGGGAERVWALLATGLSARGHQVLIAVDYEATETLPVLGIANSGPIAK